VVVLASLLLLPTAPCAEAADWLSLRTPHFLVIGDASPKEIARVALRAEQFNEVIANVYPDLTRRPTAPIVVVVSRTESRSSRTSLAPTARRPGSRRLG
jgi:hypothetical protein